MSPNRESNPCPFWCKGQRCSRLSHRAGAEGICYKMSHKCSSFAAPPPALPRGSTRKLSSGTPGSHRPPCVVPVGPRGSRRWWPASRSNGRLGSGLGQGLARSGYNSLAERYSVTRSPGASLNEPFGPCKPQRGSGGPSPLHRRGNEAQRSSVLCPRSHSS